MADEVLILEKPLQATVALAGVVDIPEFGIERFQPQMGENEVDAFGGRHDESASGSSPSFPAIVGQASSNTVEVFGQASSASIRYWYASQTPKCLARSPCFPARSINSTRWPRCWSATARWATVVVLLVPPLSRNAAVRSVSVIGTHL